MSQLINTISRLYDFRILAAYLFLFFICCLKNFQFIPDVFDMSNIASPETLLLTMWSVTVGSSSLILTILLVVYSSISKKIKRNSLELILENPWIRFIFTFFASSVLFVSISFLMVQTLDYATASFLYSSSIITLSNILIQFPLVILALKYSDSHSIVRRMISDISKKEINDLLGKSNESNEMFFIEHLEKNKIIMVKDIGIHAIREGDWALPQNILNDLYDKFIKEIDNKITKEELNENLDCFSFICEHFKIHSISESDIITTKVLHSLLFRSHIHLANNEVRAIRRNSIEVCLKDLHRLIIGNNSFYNFQQYLLRDLIRILKYHFESFKYTDEELRLKIEYFEVGRDESEISKITEIARDYWFYLTHELPDLFFDNLAYAIEIGNKNVYSRFNWQLHSIFEIVYNSKNLTEHQMEEAFDDYYYRAGKIVDIAIENEIYDNIDIISNHQIKWWLVKNRSRAFQALFSLTKLLLRLNEKQVLSEYYIDQLFFIGRSISNQKMNPEVKLETFKTIIKTGYSIFDNAGTPAKIKKELIRQFHWLNDYLKGDEDLVELKNKYSNGIDKL